MLDVRALGIVAPNDRVAALAEVKAGKTSHSAFGRNLCQHPGNPIQCILSRDRSRGSDRKEDQIKLFKKKWGRLGLANGFRRRPDYIISWYDNGRFLAPFFEGCFERSLPGKPAFVTVDSDDPVRFCDRTRHIHGLPLADLIENIFRFTVNYGDIGGFIF